MRTASPAFGGVVIGAAMVLSLVYTMGDMNGLWQVIQAVAGRTDAALSAMWSHALMLAGTLQ